tara:strand:+ start:96 stop:239 length:144 start_codon:yes stop_codon:yes gene_type:complete
MPNDFEKSYGEEILGTIYPVRDLKMKGLSPIISGIRRSFIDINPFAL